MWCKQGEETGFLVSSSARGDFNADMATRGKLGPAIIGRGFWNSNGDMLVIISKCMGSEVLPILEPLYIFYGSSHGQHGGVILRKLSHECRPLH